MKLKIYYIYFFANIQQSNRVLAPTLSYVMLKAYNKIHAIIRFRKHHKKYKICIVLKDKNYGVK